MTASAKPNKPQAKYVLGVSNTLVGNGWREEMICAVKAQAAASGVVSKVVVANRNGGSLTEYFGEHPLPSVAPPR